MWHQPQSQRTHHAIVHVSLHHAYVAWLLSWSMERKITLYGATVDQWGDMCRCMWVSLHLRHLKAVRALNGPGWSCCADSERSERKKNTNMKRVQFYEDILFLYNHKGTVKSFNMRNVESCEVAAPCRLFWITEKKKTKFYNRCNPSSCRRIEVILSFLNE